MTAIDMPRHNNRGFTLIELLIAISLTVVTGVISYQFLDAAIRVQQQGDSARQALAAIDQAWQLMASDLQNAIDRPVVTPATGTDVLLGSGIPADSSMRRPSMMTAQFFSTSLAQQLSRDGALLWFSRQGWVNPLAQQRSDIQRILYRLDDNGNFYRDYWPERNQALSVAPEASLLLLEHVAAVQFGFLPAGQDPDAGAWLAQWPLEMPGQQTDSAGGDTSPLPARFLPAAVRVRIEFSDVDSDASPQVINSGSVVERIFLMAGW